MAEHTPGPWTAHNSQGGRPVIVYADGFAVCHCQTFHGKHQCGQMEANAKLIAAAPDLLKACNGLLQMLEINMPTTYFLSDSRVNAARDAIAKAES